MTSHRTLLAVTFALVTVVPLAYGFRDQAQQTVIDKAQADKHKSSTQAASDVQASPPLKTVRAGHP
jgi:hypothetical protein